MTAPLADDTALDIERRQLEAWRAMGPAEKAALISSLSQVAYDLALAGVRHRYPNGSPREHALRLAILTLGRDLASRAYPEIDGLPL